MQRLVVCADGTWYSKARRFPSNVVRLSSLVQPQSLDGTTQLVYYEAGVGTGNLADKVLGGAFGLGLGRHVLDCYDFLVQNYQPGDEIYLFGFSRGAFTVRSLAGMLRNVGLLSRHNARRELEAWKLYTRRDDGPDTNEAVDFRALHSVDGVSVKFIGVWETVGAMGVPGWFRFLTRKRVGFHDMRLSRIVQHAYQALAIDENRGTFPPAVWEQDPDAAPDQVLEQVWFPGDHDDVGGGNHPGGLPVLALRWLALKAEATGLAIDRQALDQIVADAVADELAELHDARNGVWKLVPILLREIGVGGPKFFTVPRQGPSNERLSHETRLRYQKLETYRPVNLQAYLKDRPEALEIEDPKV